MKKIIIVSISILTILMLFGCGSKKDYTAQDVADSIADIAADDEGNVVAIIDLAWPQGIQSGLSEPVALLLNETADTQAIVSKHGYRYYTSVPELKQYVTATFLT